jgi:hypothetical protein
MWLLWFVYGPPLRVPLAMPKVTPSAPVAVPRCDSTAPPVSTIGVVAAWAWSACQMF